MTRTLFGLCVAVIALTGCGGSHSQPTMTLDQEAARTAPVKGVPQHVVKRCDLRRPDIQKTCPMGSKDFLKAVWRQLRYTANGYCSEIRAKRIAERHPDWRPLAIDNIATPLRGKYRDLRQLYNAAAEPYWFMLSLPQRAPTLARMRQIACKEHPHPH